MQVLPQLGRVTVLCLATLLMLVRGRSEESAGNERMEAFFRARGYEPVRLELTRQNKLMAAGVLEDRKIRCLVDTGWSQSSVTAPYVGHATELTNIVAGGFDAFGAVFAPQQEHLVALETLKLGRCQFMGQPVSVIAATHRHSMADDAPTGSLIPRSTKGSAEYNLVLGWDFLVRNFALIDCNRATLYFRGAEAPASLQTTIRESLRQSGFSEIPLQETHYNHGIVAGRMKDREVLFQVDTGAFASQLDQEEAKRLGLVGHSLHARAIGAAGGSSELDLAHTDDIQLAGHRVGKYRIGISDLSALNKLRQLYKLPPIVGIIGMDLLSRDEAVVDCQGGRIFMRSHAE